MEAAHLPTHTVHEDMHSNTQVMTAGVFPASIKF